AEEYGPIVRINVFHKVALLVLSPEGVKSRGPLGIWSGSTPRNMAHTNPVIFFLKFSSYLMGLIETFNDQAEELMKELEKKADGETIVDVMSLLRRVTLDIIAKVAFGLELKTLHDDKTPFLHAVNMVTIGLRNLRVPLFELVMSDKKYMPWNRKVVKEIRESVKLLRRTGKECIEQRKRAIQNEEDVPLDVLTQILKNAGRQENGTICMPHFMFILHGNTKLFVGLGSLVSDLMSHCHETSANQLSFTIMELARHPEMIAKLQAEVDDIIGMKRSIAYKDLVNLKYLSQVLKESLRLYPPAVATLRWTGKENIINGIKIPADTTLIVSLLNGQL
ncbi:hypothetical protein JD844_020732, partial [Phrynosoma platyrhinos]